MSGDLAGAARAALPDSDRRAGLPVVETKATGPADPRSHSRQADGPAVLRWRKSKGETAAAGAAAGSGGSTAAACAANETAGAAERERGQGRAGSGRA